MKPLAAILALGTFVFALTDATSARADAPAITTEHRPNRTVLWTGVTVFAVTYTASVVAGGVAGDRVEDKNLFIPLVGPWLDLGQRNCEFRGCNADEEVIFKTLIISSGIAQGAGVLLALSSFFVPETTTSTLRAAARPAPEVRFTPVSYAGGAGVGAVGRF